MTGPWAVYRSDLIKWMTAPQNEEFVSAHQTAREAMNEANRLKRGDRAHSYVVGSADAIRRDTRSVH